MTAFPDPGAIDAVAHRIAAHAAAARTRARTLEHGAHTAGWRGLAAEAFTGSTADNARALRHAADRLDDAAGALHRHARAVERTLAALHILAVRSGRTAEAVLEALGHLGRDVGDLARSPGLVMHEADILFGDAGYLAGDAGAALSGAAQLIGV